MAMLGRFNCMEQRIYLSIVGIFGVVMGLLVSYGLCSVIGLPFGPMHNVIPFLLLGIGIDDMFVIVQSWDTLPDEDQVKFCQFVFFTTFCKMTEHVVNPINLFWKKSRFPPNKFCCEDFISTNQCYFSIFKQNYNLKLIMS